MLVDIIPADAEIEGDEAELCRLALRVERDRRLVESDWTQIPDVPVDRDAWASYRQELRDLPATIPNPGRSVDFPDPPA